MIVDLCQDLFQHVCMYLDDMDRWVLTMVHKTFVPLQTKRRPCFSMITHLSLSFFRWMMEEWNYLEASTMLFPLAVRCGSVECVREILDCEYDCQSTAFALLQACRNGDRIMLSFLDNYHLLPRRFLYSGSDSDCGDEDVYRTCPYVCSLIESGSVDSLQWFLERGFAVIDVEVWNRYYFFAIRSYHKPMFDFLYESLHIPLQQTFFVDPLEYCARFDRFELMVWMIENQRMVLNDHVFTAAVSCGNMETVDWLYRHDCPRNVSSLKKAVSIRHPLMIETLLSWNPEWRSDPLICSEAARFRDISLLRLLRDHYSCEWDETTVCHAAMKGHLHIVKYCVRKGCPWNNRFLPSCIQNNHLHILKWAQRHDVVFTAYHFWYAVAYNRIRIVRWLYKQKCPFHLGDCLEKSPSSSMTRLLLNFQ